RGGVGDGFEDMGQGAAQAQDREEHQQPETGVQDTREPAAFERLRQHFLQSGQRPFVYSRNTNPTTLSEARTSSGFSGDCLRKVNRSINMAGLLVGTSGRPAAFISSARSGRLCSNW